MTINVKKIFDYWYREAGYSWNTANTLFDNKKYPESLFFAHLALEKILKAIVVVDTKQHAPPIHDLRKLTKISKIYCTVKQLDELSGYSEFNIAGRYDVQKMTFRKKCTFKYTQNQISNVKKCYLWLKKEAIKISRLK